MKEKKYDLLSSYSWSASLRLSVLKGIFRNDTSQNETNKERLIAVHFKMTQGVPVNRHSSSFSHAISHSFQDQLSHMLAMAFPPGL